jgi:ferredoxin--NADP+ reductase
MTAGTKPAASPAERFTVERITDITPWTPSLFSFRTTRHRGYRFAPGQFARLGLRKEDGEIVWRAYSIASADYDEHLEFFSIVVPGGEFTSRLSRLQVGEPVLVEKLAYGFLTTSRFECGRDLWMLSTGTGLAPFLSILYDFSVWEQYENLVLVHSVRRRDELAYAELIRGLSSHEFYAAVAHKLRYVQVVTREKVAGALSQRITGLIESGELEREAGLKLDHDRSRIMICGNPEMVDDTRDLLTGRGFALSRRGKPGHLAVENLW